MEKNTILPKKLPIGYNKIKALVESFKLDSIEFNGMDTLDSADTEFEYSRGAIMDSLLEDTSFYTSGTIESKNTTGSFRSRFTETVKSALHESDTLSNKESDNFIFRRLQQEIFKKL